MFLFILNNKNSQNRYHCLANKVKTGEEEDLKENELKKEINEECNVTWIFKD